MAESQGTPRLPTPHPQAFAEFPPCSEVSMTPAERRRTLLRMTDVLIDIGANEGQYGAWARKLGFKGRIISFEPQQATCEALSRAARGDDLWEYHRVAIGESDGELELHVFTDSTMTSAFSPTPNLLRSFPESVETGTEIVPMRSMLSLWPSLNCAGQRVFFKADVEGYELAVLRGAGAVLRDVAFMELELSLGDTFLGAPLIQDVLAFLSDQGFSVLALEQNHADEYDTGQMYMVDGIFRRDEPHLGPNPSTGRISGPGQTPGGITAATSPPHRPGPAAEANDA
jgi:FkbM family methyltransferase